MRRFHAFASQPHYREHLQPIIDAMHPDAFVGWLDGPHDADPTVVTLVAGWSDAHVLRAVPKVYVEHGAGQTYQGSWPSSAHPGYSNRGDRLQNVVGFICPSETVAERFRPYAPAAAAGCPRLDALVRMRETRESRDQPVAFLTFHWDCTVAPESRSAFDAWADDLPRVVDWLRTGGFHVVGTEHPRWKGRLAATWDRLAVPFTPNADDVLPIADLVIADNTSLMYEAAALGAQVFALNAPWYRRDVEHGLRFWSHIPGLNFDDADDLCSAPADGPLRYRSALGELQRHAAVAHTYAQVGGSARAAAAFLRRIIDDMV